MIETINLQQVEDILGDGCMALGMSDDVLNLAENLTQVESEFERNLMISFILKKVSSCTVKFSVTQTSKSLKKLIDNYGSIEKQYLTEDYDTKIAQLRMSALNALKLIGVTPDNFTPPRSTSGSLDCFLVLNSQSSYIDALIELDNSTVMKLGSPMATGEATTRFSVLENVIIESSLRSAMEYMSSKKGLIAVFSIENQSRTLSNRFSKTIYTIINNGVGIYCIHNPKDNNPYSLISNHSSEYKSARELPLSGYEIGGVLKLIYSTLILAKGDYLKQASVDDVSFIESSKSMLPVVIDYKSIMNPVISKGDVLYKDIAERLNALCKEFDKTTMIPESLKSEVLNLSLGNSTEERENPHMYLEVGSCVDFYISKNSKEKIFSRQLLTFDVNTVGTEDYIRSTKLKVARFNKATMIELMMTNNYSSLDLIEEFSALIKTLGTVEIFRILKESCLEQGCELGAPQGYKLNARGNTDLLVNMYQGTSLKNACEDAKHYHTGSPRGQVAVDLNGVNINKMLDSKNKAMDYTGTSKPAHFMFVNFNNLAFLYKLLAAYEATGATVGPLLKRKVEALEAALPLGKNGQPNSVRGMTHYPKGNVEDHIHNPFDGGALLVIAVTKKQLKEITS